MRNRHAPIPRVGFAEALVLIRDKGYRLLGRELVSPPADNVLSPTSGNAEGHVTQATKQKLLKALAKRGRKEPA